MGKFANVVQAKAEMSMTKDQIEERRKDHVAEFLEKHNPDNWPDQSEQGLKDKIKEIHKMIVKMEQDRYDLEKRLEGQTYEIKEMNERQRQIARNEAAKEGAVDADGKKAKVQVMAKGERQIDRRNFKERRRVFIKKGSIPHYPNVPPPPDPMEHKIMEDAGEEEEEED